MFEEIEESRRSSFRSPRSVGSDSRGINIKSQEEGPLSRVEDEVRVLGEFAGSPVESFSSQVKGGGDASRTPEDGVQTSGELEGAVLLVDEPGRTRKYSLLL